LWCGGRYVRLSEGQPDRFGAILLGAALGLAQGLIFALISAVAMPADPSETSKALALEILIIAIGVVVCAILCTFTARATLRQYRTGQL
jgi:hypothetical protein